MKKIELEKNVSLTMVNTSQFKDVMVTIRFLAKTTRKNVLIRKILAEMLEDRCAAWPTKQALSSHLDNLYGASVNCRCANYGKSTMFEYRFKGLNDQYTQENTLECLFKTAAEFVWHPLMKEGLLDEELFNEAKKECIMANARRLEQPSSRAIANSCALFGKGYALAETQLYKTEEIEAITLQEVTEGLHQMLHHDAVLMFVIGKIDEEKTEAYTKRFFPFEVRDIEIEHIYNIEKEKLEEVEMTMKIDQTNLVLMFTTPITVKSEKYWAFRVANGLFGQLPTSLLFQEVREKRSLCYSINSSTLGYEGGLMVNTGIQKSKIEETKECILAQVERMRQGEFTDEDLLTSKLMLKNAISGSYDDPMSTLNFAFQNALFGQEETLEDCILAIEATEKKDVMNLFKECKHVLTYSLQQEDDHE